MTFPRGRKEVKCKTCQIVVSITWESWGLFQLTGTSPLELEPDEVEEVLLVTAITGGFPFRPAAVRWSPYLCPMIGVCRGKWCQLFTKIINEGKTIMKTWGRNDLWDIKVEVQSFARKLLWCIIKYACKGNLWRAAGFCAVRALHIVWDNKAGGAGNHQLQDVLGFLPVWTL